MKVLIVEDETAAYINLKNVLNEIDSTVEAIGITESVSQTVSWLQSNPLPDLIFMDIHLSDGSAFKIFNCLAVETPIIFTTAYDEYAIDAFKVNSIDYLLKPIETQDVRRALDKFRKRTQPEAIQYINQLNQIALSTEYVEKILISINDKLIPVKLKEVSCFYTSKDRTQVMLKNKLIYTYNKSLDNIFQTLNPNDFFRANKQFIVSKEAVEDITIWFDNRLLLSLDIPVPERIYVSRNKAAEFKKWIVNSDISNIIAK